MSVKKETPNEMLLSENKQLRTERVAIKAALETLYGIELLDYHNKNFLAFDNKRNSEEKQSLLKFAISKC